MISELSNIFFPSGVGLLTRVVIGLIGILGIFSFINFLNLILSEVLLAFRKPDLKKYAGSWAVVTGATDGIGAAMCRQLAKNKLNIVLISRTQEKLEQCAKDIKSQFPVEVKTIAADFSQTDIYERISEELKNLTIGVLVNNVGVSYDHAEYYHLLDNSLIEKMIHMNVTSVAEMTRIVLPGMVARKKGAIVNVSSAAGVLPSGNPLYALYSGTKSFVDTFSKSLYWELKDKGVHVQSQVPYFVTSKLSKIHKTSFFTPNPDGYARHAVRAIGVDASVVPYPAHRVQHWAICDLVPSWLARFTTIPMLISTHHAIRNKAYKKLAKKVTE